jgi:hypothetical protein
MLALQLKGIVSRGGLAVLKETRILQEAVEALETHGRSLLCQRGNIAINYYYYG